MYKVLSALLLFLTLSGCDRSEIRLFKSSEEKLFDVCKEKLARELKNWAKYDGWSLDKLEAHLYKMEPDAIRNEKYKTDQFYTFEVLLTDFTVKNGFNADVKSISSCTGYVSKTVKGDYQPPSLLLVTVDLNGRKLGL